MLGVGIWEDQLAGAVALGADGKSLCLPRLRCSLPGETMSAGDLLSRRALRLGHGSSRSRRRRQRKPVQRSADSGGRSSRSSRWCGVQALVIGVAAKARPEERMLRADLALLALVVVDQAPEVTW